jgi:hypothetical protein
VAGPSVFDGHFAVLLLAGPVAALEGVLFLLAVFSLSDAVLFLLEEFPFLQELSLLIVGFPFSGTNLAPFNELLSFATGVAFSQGVIIILK